MEVWEISARSGSKAFYNIFLLHFLEFLVWRALGLKILKIDFIYLVFLSSTQTIKKLK